MALNNQTRETLENTNATNRSSEPGSVSEEDEEVEEEELEKLESEAKQMAKKILEYRSTLPHQLNTTLTSILSAQRPILPDFEFGSDPGPSSDSKLEEGEQKQVAEKVGLLKNKISSNVSAMPTVLKRLKECISRIDNLDSSNHGIIHPAFANKTG